MYGIDYFGGCSVAALECANIMRDECFIERSRYRYEDDQIGEICHCFVH